MAPLAHHGTVNVSFIRVLQRKTVHLIIRFIRLADIDMSSCSGMAVLMELYLAKVYYEADRSALRLFNITRTL